MIDTLLARLDGVRSTGRSRWLARCPAHEDKSPSLSVQELDDGRILIHCFAGCGGGAVLAVVGLDFAALYPEGFTHERADRRRRRAMFAPIDALRLVESESILVAVLASDLGRGKPATDEIRSRLFSAAGRIAHALKVCHGGR